MSHDSRLRRTLAAFSGLAALLAVTLAFAGSASALASHGRTARHHSGKLHQRNHPHRFAHNNVTGAPWGSVDGQQVNLYTLTNARGMKVNISNYGGVVQSIWVPDRHGNLVNVALGFPTLSDYVNDFTQGATSTPWPAAGGSGDTYFGAIIGRYANRIANASFGLNGTTYKLDANNGVNSLHGGYLGWNTQVWNATPSSDSQGAHLTLTADFPAGEGCLPTLSPGCTGYPAPVSVSVTYTLTCNNQLKIFYSVKNDSSTDATVVNVTNHTYFNLAGEASGDIYNQDLALNSDAYTPVNSNLIPEPPYFVPVSGTAYDFRSMHPIGQYITDASLPDGTTGPLTQLQIAHGYDNNWVLNDQGSYRLAAVAQDPQNGITMWTFTDQPGVQLYTSNFLVGDLIGTSGHIYRQGAGFTLETQHYPDSPNHIGESGWPSVVLDPGATFTSQTAFAFGDEPGNYASKVHFP
jgi:aldose 1-epimerase